MTNTASHHTPQYANEMAEQVIELIKELHETTYMPLSAMRLDAERRFCKEQHAQLAMVVLQIGCGLSTLAQHAARLQEAAENKKYARHYWSSVVYN